MSDGKEFIRLTAVEYRNVMTFLKEGKHIQAIKLVRNGALHSDVGLKIAKYAVDRLRHEQVDPTRTFPSEARKIITGPEILKVTLDYGDGPIELDIEGMQMRALTELQNIGLEACADMLQLVDVFRAMAAGKKVLVVDDESLSA
jgi:hypothetical protein